MGVDCLDVSGYIRKPSAKPFNGLLGRFSGLLISLYLDLRYAIVGCFKLF
jgi:hypothetical protein